MKKFIAVILAILYLGTSTGATVHMHFCMGKLADWGLWNSDSKTCGKCGMDKTDDGDNGCCKDKQMFIKNANDQKVAESFVLKLVQPTIELPAEYFFPLLISLPSITEKFPISNAPPRGNGIAVFLLNRSFLI